MIDDNAQTSQRPWTDGIESTAEVLDRIRRVMAELNGEITGVDWSEYESQQPQTFREKMAAYKMRVQALAKAASEDARYPGPGVSMPSLETLVAALEVLPDDTKMGRLNLLNDGTLRLEFDFHMAGVGQRSVMIRMRDDHQVDFHVASGAHGTVPVGALEHTLKRHAVLYYMREPLPGPVRAF